MILGSKRITQKKLEPFKRVCVQIREMELIFINNFFHPNKNSFNLIFPKCETKDSKSLIISIMSSLKR